MDIICKDVSYKFDSHPNYAKAYDLAEENIEQLYIKNQIEESEEAEEMLEDGAIDSIEEYDFEYAEPYDPNKFLGKIYELTNEYMRNFLDLPKNVVIETTADKIKEITEEELMQAIESKYNVPVQSIKTYDKANEKDLWQQKSYDSINNMINSNDYKTFLDLKTNLSKYSANNLSLIYIQKPDAKAVKGFNSWNKDYNRSINKGEHHIKIWCPTTRLLKTEKQVDDYVSYNYIDSVQRDLRKDELMKEIEENGSAKVISGFNLGKVFDISQTVSRDPEHDKLDEIIRLNKPLSKNMNNFQEVKATIRKVMGERANHIIIDSNLSEQDQIYSIAQQYADYILSNEPDSVVGIKNRDVLSGSSHKIETAIAATLICENMGIESNDKTAFALTAIMDKASVEIYTEGKRNLFINAFDRGSKLANQFNKDFDKQYSARIDKNKNTSHKKTIEIDDR